MTKQLLTVLGALSLVACGGSGVPYDGGGAPQLDDWGSHPGIAGTGTTGGAQQGQGGVGGEETAGAGGTYAGAGGYEMGGTDSSGHAGSGGYGVAGTGSGGTYAGGAGGVTGGGYANGGTGVGGGDGSVCLQNVAQCFDAAANCYQYSPWSDCDQIVDVCAAMQAECGE